MKIEYLAAAALFVAAGSAGCSSQPEPTGLQPGLKPGTAQLTVAGADVGRIKAVQCVPAEDTTSIVIGPEPPVAAATIAHGEGDEVKWVKLRSANGFTGSFNADLDGEADVELVGSTYQITGVARGFDEGDARRPVTAKFAIEVSC